MIHFLRVRNLAIVEEFAIELGDGFNVLTGETGAGKSLLIDSLELLSGARSSADNIRAGEEKLLAEAILHLPSELTAALAEAGVAEAGEGDPELVVRRELTTSGRGKVSVNGSLMTVRELSRLMDSLLEIHGQSASHERIAGQTFRDVLDEYADVADLRRSLESLHEEWRLAAGALEEQEAADQSRDQQIEHLRAQIEELENARIGIGEDAALREERAVLANSESLMKATSSAWNLLEEDELSVTSALARARAALAPLENDVQEIRGLADQLDQAALILTEAVRDLGRLADGLRHDPERLEEIESRLALLERLARRFARPADELPALLKELNDRLAALEDSEARREKLAAAEEQAFARWRARADELSGRRREAAPQLAGAIASELADLAMEGTTVQVVVAAAEDQSSRLQIDGRGIQFGPSGYDRVDIHIAANRGEQPRPLSRVASGGELSRMQLAIAAAMFRNRRQQGAATLVFDEIDTGVGGRVAEAIGRKLRELAETNQVICVTHLPQIAALADVQFRVWKEETNGRTTARIARLESIDDRVTELARMLGGESITESARAHARQLLATGSEAEMSSGTPSHRRLKH